MDITFVASPPLPRPLLPLYSDHSHSLFYAPSRPLRFRPSPSSSRISSSSSSLFAPAQEACDSQLSLPAQEAALALDFTHLKDQLKQKKKQLKAVERQAKRQKKRKMMNVKADRCDSSSSSSSESSDDERCSPPVLAKTLNKRLGLGLAASDAEIGLGQLEITTATMPVGADARAARDASGGITASYTPSSRASNGMAITGGQIQVCFGGKCKKAGSEQLMTSLKERIPSNCGVEAVPCKCMGKCAMAINVKVQRNETNPQHHCHVGPDDANHILSRYFSVGLPFSTVPSFAAPCTSPAHIPTTFSSP